MTPNVTVVIAYHYNDPDPSFEEYFASADEAAKLVKILEAAKFRVSVYTVNLLKSVPEFYKENYA